MDPSLPDNFLQPVIDAFAPTDLGSPKTQAVFDRFLDKFETVLKLGYTYKQIAEALKTGNVRGRRGAEIKEGALHNYITRAKERRARKLARPGTSNVAGEPRGYDLEPPTTSTGQSVSANVSISPALGEFKRRIAEAQSHAAMDEIVFRGRNKRG